jgi:hypothetical protein
MAYSPRKRRGIRRRERRHVVEERIGRVLVKPVLSSVGANAGNRLQAATYYRHLRRLVTDAESRRSKHHWIACATLEVESMRLGPGAAGGTP